MNANPTPKHVQQTMRRLSSQISAELGVNVVPLDLDDEQQREQYVFAKYRFVLTITEDGRISTFTDIAPRNQPAVLRMAAVALMKDLAARNLTDE